MFVNQAKKRTKKGGKLLILSDFQPIFLFFTKKANKKPNTLKTKTEHFLPEPNKKPNTLKTKILHAKYKKSGVKKLSKKAVYKHKQVKNG